MGIFAAAEALVGLNDAANSTQIASFISSYLGTTIDPTSVYWSGYFAAAALTAAGYTIPQGYAFNQSWQSFGQTISSAQLNCIVVWPQNSSGYGQVGIATSIDSLGNVTVLVGDYAGAVVEQVLDVSQATFVSQLSGIQNTAASNISSQVSTPITSPQQAAAIASATAAALAAISAAQTPQRQGSQTGNTDTPEKLTAVDQSGPMPCGSIHPDVTGSLGNYTASQTYSPVSRLPTHEPFTQHPKSMVGGSPTPSDAQAPGGSGAAAGTPVTSTAATPNTPTVGTGGNTGANVGGGSTGATVAPGSKIGATTGTTLQKEAAVYAALKATGSPYLSNSIQIAVVMGNIQQESSFNTQSLNIGDNKRNAATPIPGLIINGHQVTEQDSFGMGQWNGARLIGLYNYAKANGLKITDASAQAGFMAQEYVTTHKSSGAILASLANATTIPANAAAQYGHKYEVFGDNSGNARNNYAAGVFTNIQNGTLQKIINNTPALQNSTIGSTNSLSAPNNSVPSATTKPSGTTGTPAATKAVASAATANAQNAANAAAVAAATPANTPGQGGGQGPTQLVHATVNANGYQPGTPGSIDPTAGQSQNGQNGTTPNGSSDGASSSSPASSPASSTSSSSSAQTTPTTDSGPTSTPVAAPTTPLPAGVQFYNPSTGTVSPTSSK